MAAVLYDPVAPVDLQEPLPRGGAAGDAVGELSGALPGFLLQHPPLDEEGLGDLGEVEVVVEGCGDPYAAGFDAPVAAGGLGELGSGAVLEVALEVSQERGAIALDAEVVVSAAAADELGDGALGQQCIGGDVLILQVQLLEQRNCGFDLIGLLERVRIARYGQSADFF